MARHALKKFLSSLIFLFAFVLILRSVAFADPNATITVTPDRVRVGDEFTVEGTIFASDIAGVSVGATLSVCGERSCRFQCGGGCYQGQCSALISASGPVRACPASAPNGLNFFAYDLPGGGPVFDSGSQFRITYTVLPGSRSGRYNAAMGIRHLRGDTEQFITTYTIEDAINVNITALPPQIFPADLSLTPTTSRLHVAVTDDQGNPVTSPQELTFDVSVPRNERTQDSLEKRGGHAHQGYAPPRNRPLGTIHVLSSQVGRSSRTIPLEGDSNDSATFQETTDSSGNLYMNYLASRFGGVITIKGSPAANQDNFATITVGLPADPPDLVLLPNNPSLYMKSGGTLNHPGPCNKNQRPDCDDLGTRFVRGYPNIDLNHSISSERSPITGRSAYEDFLRAARDYLQDTGQQLIVNDMSLPKGGVFDIRGDWTEGFHAYHRVGRSVDIENSRSRALFRAFEGPNHWEFIEEGPLRYPHFQYPGFRI